MIEIFGQILMEDIKFDEQGQILTGSFMDYAMPRASDLVWLLFENVWPPSPKSSAARYAFGPGNRRR